MQESEKYTLKRQIRFVRYSDGTITGRDSDGHTVVASLPVETCYKQLPALLREDCKLNLLSCEEDSEGTLHPEEIIFEPDYLIDISALARCVQPYGSPALGYIINLFEKSTDSAARLLGEAANMFLDDCVNERPEKPATYSESIKKFFREYSLQLSVCNEIDNNFFALSRQQFNNIQMKVGNSCIESEGSYHRDRVYLEPSFFCEPLGLQGRIDLLQSDCSHLIELKSGKSDEFNGGAKAEHRIQMSLYKEMLRYSLQIPREAIRPHLFYSRYPRFYSQESSRSEMSRTLMLRNQIVALLIEMGNDGLRSTLLNTSPADLNTKGDYGRLWTNYLRPRIEEVLNPIKTADAQLLGAAGLPVFSGFTGGIGHMLGPTGGYMIGFVLSALLMWLMERLMGRSQKTLVLSMIAGLLVCYAFGTVWFMILYTRDSGSIGIMTALTWCVIPYIIPDALKILLASVLTRRLRPLIKG